MYTEIPTATTRKPIQRDIAKNTTDKKAKLKKKVLIIQEGKKRETEEQTEKNKNGRPKSTY